MNRVLGAVASLGLALFFVSRSAAQAMPIDLREGELAASVGMPLEVNVAHALTLPIPLTVGATGLPLVGGASLSIGVRPVLTRFADHRLILVTSVGALVLTTDGVDAGARADVGLQLVFTTARTSALDVLFALTPAVDVAVTGGTHDAWRLRAGLSGAFGLSFPRGSLWLAGDLGTTIDDLGSPTIRGGGQLIGSLRL
ncbi:MAG: hypothetical protein J0L92_05720 [Deltaproteobacteria bacterium]|nr:hypothetical protein [Deltaproteobacteria bacterium]